jgi:hypothetical protein
MHSRVNEAIDGVTSVMTKVSHAVLFAHNTVPSTSAVRSTEMRNANRAQDQLKAPGPRMCGCGSRRDGPIQLGRSGSGPAKCEEEDRGSATLHLREWTQVRMQARGTRTYATNLMRWGKQISNGSRFFTEISKWK